MKILLNIVFISFYLNSNIDFVILIPSYNNKKWYQLNLNSAINQNYKNFRIIYADDCSSDGTPDLVRDFINDSIFDESRFNLVVNKKRKSALKNIYDVVHKYCKDNEVIVLLDGDDELYDNNVLSYLNEVYSSGDVWMTYGTAVDKSTGIPCSWNMPYPKDVVEANSFRSWHRGAVTHLRTFKASLFKKIKKEDLTLNGQFFPITYDVAMFMPMIEMAGDRFRFLDKSLYIYNDVNDLNDHKSGRGVVQLAFNTYIRSLKPYNRIQ